MATLQDRSTVEMEQALQNGFSLSWLQQIKDQVPGSAEELERDPTLAENTPDLLDESPNQTQRMRGAVPREGIPQFSAYTFRDKKEVWGLQPDQALPGSRIPPVVIGHGYSVGNAAAFARRH